MPMIGVGTSSGFFATAVGVGDGGTAGRAGGCCEQDTDIIDGNTIDSMSRRLVTGRHRAVFGNLQYPPIRFSVKVIAVVAVMRLELVPRAEVEPACL